MTRRRWPGAWWIAALACAGLPRGASSLDLEAALARADAANPTLSARRSMVEAARRRVGPAGAWTSPMLELGVVNVPESGRFDEDVMTMKMKMLGLSQRVPVFGANRLARRAAVENVAAEGAAADAARWETFGATWERYADAYYADEQVRQAEAHQDVMDRLVGAARARYRSGNGRLEDPLRAESERARLWADLSAFRAEAQATRARLQEVLGGDPGIQTAFLVPPPTPLVPDGLEPWLAGLDSAHPRLRESGARATRYRLAARGARRMAWPDLELRGAWGFREPIAGMPQDAMFSLSVGLMLPVFAGARELSEGAEMEAMARVAEAERRATELDLRVGIQAAWASAVAA